MQLCIHICFCKSNVPGEPFRKHWIAYWRSRLWNVCLTEPNADEDLALIKRVAINKEMFLHCLALVAKSTVCQSKIWMWKQICMRPSYTKDVRSWQTYYSFFYFFRIIRLKRNIPLRLPPSLFQTQFPSYLFNTNWTISSTERECLWSFLNTCHSLLEHLPWS